MAGQDSLSSRSIELDEALDRSLALLERGRTPEDCLGRFPERADELRPLLRVAAQVWRVPAPAPSFAEDADGRQRMLEALAQKKAARRGPGDRIEDWGRALFAGVGLGTDAQRLLRSVAIAVAVVALIAVGTVVARSWQGMTVRQEALLASQGGLVEVLPPGADAWLPVSEAIMVEAGDRIRTGAEGAAELTFFDGSVTKLRPMAELSIVQMTSQRSGHGNVIALHQWLGECHHQVGPLRDGESRFGVQTASAVMAVRGTAFTVIVKPDGATHLVVEEGIVAVQTRETSMLVSGGEDVLLPSLPASLTASPEMTPGSSEAPASPTQTAQSGSSSPTGSPEPPEMTESSPTPVLDGTRIIEEGTTPQPTSTGGTIRTATESPSPTATATQEARPKATDEPSPTATEQPPPTATDEPSSTATEQPPPTATDEPSPTVTDQPPPTATDEPSPTATEQLPPTATDEPSPTPTQQPPPTSTDPPPTATQEPPPTATEPPTATQPPPTETEPASTHVPPGQTKTPQPPGQTKTPEPPGQTKTPQETDDDAELNPLLGSGSSKQGRRSSFLHNASSLVGRLDAGLWLGIFVLFLPLSLLLHDER